MARLYQKINNEAVPLGGGGGGSVAIDNITITKNSDDEIQIADDITDKLERVATQNEVNEFTADNIHKANIYLETETPSSGSIWGNGFSFLNESHENKGNVIPLVNADGTEDIYVNAIDGKVKIPSLDVSSVGDLTPIVSTWLSTATYRKSDIVRHIGKVYEAIQETIPTGTLPTDTAYWKEFNSLGDKVTELSSNLTASDGLNFKFATDGEGNYGYLKADDSFVPFKSGGGFGLTLIKGVKIELQNFPSTITLYRSTDFKQRWAVGDVPTGYTKLTVTGTNFGANLVIADGLGNKKDYYNTTGGSNVTLELPNGIKSFFAAYIDPTTDNRAMTLTFS